MSPARGDRKPCSHADCSGTMQFGREPLPKTSYETAEAERGWICSQEPEHFQLARERQRPEPAEKSTVEPDWDDDGGAIRERNGRPN